MPFLPVTRLAAWLGLTTLAGYPATPARAPWQAERFHLSADPCAAQGYPMEIQEGYLTAASGKRFGMLPEFLQGSWGLSHTSYVQGDGTMPVPASLALRWFSYTEDKFFEGRWALPQRQLYELLHQRHWVPNQHRYLRSTELTVCLLPTGVVVVWLTGANQVLVGRYQARAVDFDFRQFNPAANRARMIKQEQAKLPAAVRARIAGGQLSSQPWDDYLRRYPWRLELSEPLRLTDSGVAYFSAERDYYSPDSASRAPLVAALLAASPKPVPRYLRVTGTLPDGRRRELKVKDFDEAETLAAFRTLHAAHPDAPITMRLETDADFTRGQLVLVSAGQRVVLTHSVLAVYPPGDD